ncbi:MAG: hypothetical protein QM754_18145 [Tepidisphaeraceae bacterium]
MNSYARSVFTQARTAGYGALESLSISRTVQAFDTAESEGLVRLEALPDEDFDLEGFSDIPGVVEEARKAIERGDGPYGVVASCLTESGEWHQADSCWGFVGYRDVLSPVENPYVVDLMRSALAAIPDPAAAI